MQRHDPSRRRFLAQVATATVVSTLVHDVAANQAGPAAAKLPKLPLDNSQAKALAYTEDAGSVKSPLHKAGSRCDNCNLYKGIKGEAYGPCQIFPQHSVAAKGWCSGWAKKA